MKKFIVLLFLFMPFTGWSQSKVMRTLANAHPDALVLMFYHSTLNMLNVDEDPEFARMIRDIEKIKVLRINKTEDKFDNSALTSLKTDLQEHDFEELMIIKSKGYDIGVYIKEDDEDIEGFFMLMDDNESFTAIDVLGSMPLGDVSKLVNKIQEVDDFKF